MVYVNSFLMMLDMIQTILALAVVAVALFFIVRGVVRAVRGRGDGGKKCSSGCCH